MRKSNSYIIKSPCTSILAFIKDRDMTNGLDIEENQKTLTFISKAAKRPLSAETIKQVIGGDSTYIDHSTVDYKLAEWRQGYLKRKAEPKKYEPMLYFLDYFNGINL